MADKTPPQAPAPEPAPIIVEERLTGLPFLRNLVTGMFFEWDADKGDEGVVSFIESIRQVFFEPLVNFDKAYDLFNKHCTDEKKANIVGDHWRTFQMIIWTELDRELVSTMSEFAKMAQRVMGDAPGGKELYPRKLNGTGGVSLGYEANGLQVPFDYLVLMAIRVYCAGIRIPSSPQPTQ